MQLLGRVLEHPDRALSGLLGPPDLILRDAEASAPPPARDSLLAVRFVGQLRELLEVNLPIRSLFTGASVPQICEILTTDPSRRERVLATAEVLAALSEHDVDHLLSEALAQTASAP